MKANAQRGALVAAIEKHLDVRAAADRLGRFFFPDDWSVDDIENLGSDADEDDAARERVEAVENELRRLLVYGTVTGYFENDECAICPLGRIIGEPWFAIEIDRERVRVWHDDWARCFSTGRNWWRRLSGQTANRSQAHSLPVGRHRF